MVLCVSQLSCISVFVIWMNENKKYSVEPIIYVYIVSCHYSKTLYLPSIGEFKVPLIMPIYPSHALQIWVVFVLSARRHIAPSSICYRMAACLLTMHLISLLNVRNRYAINCNGLLTTIASLLSWKHIQVVFFILIIFVTNLLRFNSHNLTGVWVGAGVNYSQGRSFRWDFWTTWNKHKSFGDFPKTCLSYKTAKLGYAHYHPVFQYGGQETGKCKKFPLNQE